LVAHVARVSSMGVSRTSTVYVMRIWLQGVRSSAFGSGGLSTVNEFLVPLKDQPSVKDDSAFMVKLCLLLAKRNILSSLTMGLKRSALLTDLVLKEVNFFLLHVLEM